MNTARLARSAMAARRTVRITTLRGTGEHYVALMQGDEVLLPIGPDVIPEHLVEGVAAWFAKFHGVDVSRRDADHYDIGEG